MSLHYLELTLRHPPGFADILVAELAEAGFESFSDEEEGPLKAYIAEKNFAKEALEAVLEQYSPQGVEQLSLEAYPVVNWNEEWEKNYDPVEVISGQFRIRAHFHDPDPSYQRELLIVPKMSFGTGHHPTTLLLARWLTELDLSGQQVLDMGCGTGILAILAEQQGATEILGIDNFDWAAENSAENAQLNGSQLCRFATGSLEQIPNGHVYDTLLANINMGVLREHVPQYRSYLKPSGSLFISGVMLHDAAEMRQIAQQAGYHWLEERHEGDWMAARLQLA